MLDAAGADSRLQARRLGDSRTFKNLLIFEARFFQAPLNACERIRACKREDREIPAPPLG